MIGTIISLLSGALGGNLAGSLMKDSSLGTLWNSVVGIAGGGIGGVILGMLGLGAGAGSEALDIGTIVSNVASGGVGGGVLLAIIGMIRSAMAK
ncbi:hypothetical protein [Neolewinella agarilytica]|uniref:Transglycosylase associated protein n=1 Tax=Neolewinella agarilytica TaxID=478744 RepID=A0A1H9JPG1_9BACT|nr:hypothetical protein [Neolewinella agarilytica]SEQ88722.1 hypothetical protein SAMN05444359_11812 [Neolewinella agarilytica]